MVRRPDAWTVNILAAYPQTVTYRCYRVLSRGLLQYKMQIAIDDVTHLRDASYDGMLVSPAGSVRE